MLAIGCTQLPNKFSAAVLVIQKEASVVFITKEHPNIVSIFGI